MDRKRTLYLDMDDVVADWMGEAARYLQRPQWHVDERIPHRDWDKLKQHHRFYRNLPMMPNAEHLVAWAVGFTKQQDMDLKFLTAIPHDNDMPWSIHDKILWAQERFPDIHVFFGPYSTDKHLHCRKGDILIDDRTQNCQEWRAKGGIAHQYITWPNCKVWIASDLACKIKDRQ